MSLTYSEFRARLRTSLNHRERLLEWFRMLRYALVQGPWRGWLIRRYESRAGNPVLEVFAQTLFPAIDAAVAAQALDRDAFAARFTAPPQLVDSIVEWTEGVGSKRIDDPHLDCAGVQRLARDPRIVEVARRFLHAEPILFTSKIYWTKPPADEQGRRNAAAEGGKFHYDLADIKAVTVFVYLTDVDAESGPHVVIRGTQRRTTLTQILSRSIEDEVAQRRFGDRIEVITGPRGTGWFEDITCYHKQAPGTKVRLMLSFIYSLHRLPLTPDRRRPAASSDSRAADRMLGAMDTGKAERPAV